MKVTADMLRAKGACPDQVARFVEITGGSVEITEALCIAHAEKFDWFWAARNLLPIPAWASYYAAKALAWTTYDKATNLAWKTYGENPTLPSASKTYNKATALARKVYYEAKASAFANAAAYDPDEPVVSFRIATCVRVAEA